jgi:hypothetical protein
MSDNLDFKDTEFPEETSDELSGDLDFLDED